MSSPKCKQNSHVLAQKLNCSPQPPQKEEQTVDKLSSATSSLPSKLSLHRLHAPTPLAKLPHAQPNGCSQPLLRRSPFPGMPSLPPPSQVPLNLPATYDLVYGPFYQDHVASDIFAYMSFFFPTKLGALWGPKPPLCIPGLNQCPPKGVKKQKTQIYKDHL